MGLNTYPSNPFPPSTDRMDADTLEAEVNELKSGLIDLTTALNSAKIYKNDWANNLTVPLGMCTIVMFALTTGANDMYIYNSASDVLSSIRGSGMTATKNQDNTVTFYSNAGAGRFVALILA